MKNIVLLFTSFLLLLNSCQNKHSVKISGEFKGIPVQMVYLSQLNVNEIKLIDSIQLDKKGRFKFKFSADSASFYQIELNKQFINLLVNPLEKIHIKSSSSEISRNYTITGSEGSILTKQLADTLLFNTLQLDSLEILYNKYKANGDKVKLQQVYNKYILTIKQQRNYSIKFVLGHLSSMATIMALYQKINGDFILNQNRDVQLMVLAADTLMKYYPNSDQVKALYADKERMLKTIRELKLQQLTANKKTMTFPDINLPNENGDTVTLSKYIGKTIILNFWTPKDKASLWVNDHLSALLKQYGSSKLTVFQVALDSDVENWKQFLKNNAFGINVIDKRATESIYIGNYSISTIPCTFVIDAKGTIVGRDIYGDYLETLLNHLMPN